MKKLLLMACLGALTLAAPAQTLPLRTTASFQNASGGLAGTSTLQAWTPDPAEVPVLKALFIITNRSPMCENLARFDTVFRRGARQYGYGIVLADGPIIIDWQTGRAWGDSLRAGLARLAQQSGRPEMAHAPWMVMGHSLGTQFSNGICYDQGPQVVAAIHFKLGNIYRPSWATSSQEADYATVPHMAVNGELEGPDINNGGGAYYSQSMQGDVLSRRPGGWLIHQAVEYNGNHNTLPARLAQLMVLFLGEALQARFPSGADPRTGPVALQSLAENQGWLGSRTAWNDFSAGSASISAYSASQAASQHWLLNATYAQAWQAFHTAPAQLSLAGGSSPLCPGQSLNVQVSAQPGVVFGPNNVFRVQLSTLTANFESGSYFPFTVGALRSDQGTVSIPITLPDNLHAIGGGSTPLQPSTSGAAGTYRYFVRVISTDPPLESAGLGPLTIAPATTCPEAPLLARLANWARNADDVYRGPQICTGQDTTLRVVVLRRATGPSLNVGNTLTVELSDSTGSFAQAQVVGSKASTLPFPSNSNAWFRDTVLALIPAATPAGLNYRLRVLSSDPVQTGSTIGTTLILRDCSPLGLASRTSQGPSLRIWPNPSALGQGLWVESPHESPGRWTLYSSTGQRAAQGPWSGGTEAQSLNPAVPAGLYTLELIQGPHRLRVRSVIQ